MRKYYHEDCIIDELLEGQLEDYLDGDTVELSNGRKMGATVAPDEYQVVCERCSEDIESGSFCVAVE